MSDRFQKDEQLFGCGKCLKYFSNSDNAKKCFYGHQKKHFVCKLCDASFPWNTSLICHMRTHSGERRYKCELCCATFPWQSSLIHHLRIHTGERPFKCKLCNAAFIRSGHLTVHMRIHTGARPYTCKMCDAAFCWKRSLIYHMRTHTGELPFKCKVCDAAFLQRIHLRMHMSTFTGARPHKYNERYHQSSNLVQHKHKHASSTDDRPFPCLKRGATFRWNYILKRHQCAENVPFSNVSTNNCNQTGDISFKCELCGLAFIDDIIMGIHKRSHTAQQQ